MRLVNTETPAFRGSDGTAGRPDYVEAMQLLDREGNVLATFTKDVTGAFTLQVSGNLFVSGSSQIFTASEHIADPAGAATDQDDEARAAIASILDLLEEQGLMEAEA